MKIETIQSELAAYVACEAEIPRLEKFFGDNKAALERLEVSADLGDAAAMAEITRLQAIRELEPRRIESARAAFREQHARLFTVATEFSGAEIQPRCISLRAKVGEGIKKQIARHYGDEQSLLDAIDGSSVIVKLKRLAGAALDNGNQQYRPKAFAEQLIAVWGELDQFEKTNLK
jgi:hypothetical protein